MTRTTRQRLADADPARTADAPADEALLERITAAPASTAPGPRRPRRGPRLVVPVIAGTAGAALIVLALAGGDARGPEDDTARPVTPLRLAAQAYARTTVGPGQILYTRVVTVRHEKPAGTVTRGSIDEWHRGRETHRLQRYDERLAIDHVIGADGVMRGIDQDGRYRITRRSDNEDSANVIREEQAGFVAEFRRRYEQGDLDPAGDVTFNGRPAERYRVPPEFGANTPSAPELAYYVDRETADPLGFTVDTPEGSMIVQGADGDQRAFSWDSVITVERLEVLEPTAANLAKLREHTLPRRRDRDGCITGPAVEARSHDTATRTDCGGGEPGAPLDR